MIEVVHIKFEREGSREATLDYYSESVSYIHPQRTSGKSALVLFRASAATMTPLPEIGANTTLDLIPPDSVDQPLLILRVVELVCDGRQVELQLIRDELANFRVVVVPVKTFGVGSVGDQVDVDSAVAKR